MDAPLSLRPRVETPVNPYRDNVQGKANEPITVAAILDRARKELLSEGEWVAEADWSLGAIYDRLEHNAPRIAVIGGSPDHPAHVMDPGTGARAALAIWARGGVPFTFSVPVLCDGTAQSNMGMSYSLQSRNAIAEMVVNQMEAHSYHGAFVIQSCDKMPLAVVAALAHLDTLRRFRGEPAVFAAFAPAHVLKGGEIPADVREQLDDLARASVTAGHPEVAEDLRDTMAYILQCSSNTAFQGVFHRAVEHGILSPERHKDFERALAINTCDSKGGICAFNGTGNSSRHLVAAMGLVHPAVELLTDPPTTAQVDAVVADLVGLANRPECGVADVLLHNMGNAVRLHAASGGSTNLLMHLVGAVLYAGYAFSIHDLDRIHRAAPIPDLFDYSLTQGRDIFALAKQCCSGDIRGMETLVHELVRNGAPMDLDAMTVTGTTWRQRLANPEGLSADGVTENPVILARPRRAISGVDILAGNFFESAVVKISGMPEAQVNHFDEQVALAVAYECEEDANDDLLDIHLLDRWRQGRAFDEATLRATWRHNAADLRLDTAGTGAMGHDDLFDHMVRTGTLKLAIVIAAQGPVAYGMPEMFTPMQHINANRALRKLATVISDGRYSGVSYGAAIGHVVPEAALGGDILRLKTGDPIHLRFRARRIDLLDPTALVAGRAVPDAGTLLAGRDDLAAERMVRLRSRQRRVAASNRMVGCTDASMGVVPIAVAEDATVPFWSATTVGGVSRNGSPVGAAAEPVAVPAD
ncbi:MAG: dihydroxy-acid dehydratase [Thermomicrobiales bacterium]